MLKEKESIWSVITDATLTEMMTQIKHVSAVDVKGSAQVSWIVSVTFLPRGVKAGREYILLMLF